MWTRQIIRDLNDIELTAIDGPFLDFDSNKLFVKIKMHTFMKQMEM